MIFVDTSVWISFFRGKDATLVGQLSDLLDEDRVALPFPVWIELLAGASRKDSAQLKRVLSALPRFIPTDETWREVESWTTQATKKGQRFGVMDLLIGAITSQEDGAIWSLDQDFKRLARLGFVKLHS